MPVLLALIILAGEPVRIAPDGAVAFTPKQLERSARSTRAGLVRWAVTDEGRRILAHLGAADYEIHVVEDAGEPGVGRAPQPGIATMLAAGNRSTRKTYELILNPDPRVPPRGPTILPDQPATAEDLIAAAWAAEMLHIWFYAHGQLLPHHPRADFQNAWRSVAAQLGFPALPHGEEGR